MTWSPVVLAVLASSLTAAEFHGMPGDWYGALGGVVPHPDMREAGGAGEVQGVVGVGLPWRGLAGAPSAEAHLALGAGSGARHQLVAAAYVERWSVDRRLHLGVGPIVGAARVDPSGAPVQESPVAGLMGVVGFPLVRHLDAELVARGTTPVGSVHTAALVMQVVWWP